MSVSWNPWHGCRKISEGCRHCYVYRQDALHERDSREVVRTAAFGLPVRRGRDGRFRIPPGERVYTCFTSDFLVEEADGWRAAAWEMMRLRRDLEFFFITKRIGRLREQLPPDWGDGWENVFFNVTCENQKRADERIPIMFKLPFKHKGIMAAPFVGAVSIRDYLPAGQIEQVIAGGENYDGSRPLEYEWVKTLYDECVAADVTFCFIETGTNFVKDGKTWHLPDKRRQSYAAWRSGLQYQGKKINFRLQKPQFSLFAGSESEVYRKFFGERCQTCGSRLICNGCSNCGQCGAGNAAK